MKKTAGRVGAGILLFAGASFAMSALGPGPDGVPPGSPSGSDDPRITNLAAEPRAAREGDRVLFTAEARDSIGSTLTYTWDFGDGSGERTGPDLTSIGHRYLDDREPFEVKLRVESPGGGTDEQTVKVSVQNVPPEIRSLNREGAALVGGELSFGATVTDPGVADELTYEWDFGDGNTAEGESVTHAYDETGRFEVILVVRDDDGGEDRETHTVVVGEGFAFTVGGDVHGTQTGTASIYGVTAGERASSVQLRRGYCTVIVLFEAAEGRSPLPTLGFTASVRGALRETEYAFGNDASIESWVDENANPNWFFASLGAEKTDPEEVGAPAFDSRSGVLTITHLDESRIEGTFSVDMKETAPYGFYPKRRSASVSGHFAAPLERRLGTPDFYACRPDRVFDIADRTPAVDAENVDPEQPDLELTFTEAVDLASIPDAIRVEYRTSDGQYRAVPGSWEQTGDEQTIRFVPTGILLDGVIHCVRVRAGESGVRGLAGEVREHAPPRWEGEDEEGACAAGAEWTESREWAWPTLVELESLRVDLFQVAKIEDGIALVPDKPTVARVHAMWTEKQGVHPSAQVTDFGADVRVEADGRAVYPPKSRVTIRRPDQFQDDDRRHARNSVNFFGWKPRSGGGSSVVATLEPVEQTGTPPRLFESPPVEAEHWDHAPTFTFDYYFLRIGRWATGVPPDERASGELLASRTELSTTQMFPVVSTEGRAGGDFNLTTYSSEADAEQRGATDVLGSIVAEASLGMYVRMFNDIVAPHTNATALVAFHPTSYHTGGGSLGRPLANRVVKNLERGRAREDLPYAFRTVRMGVRSDIYLTSALSHEFGHAFWLEHEPYVTSAAERSRECAGSRGLYDGIEGFRVAPGGQRGWNKSSSEGNGESTSRLYPLMYPCTQRVTESFPTNHHYRKLQQQVETAIQLGTWSGGPLVYAPDAPQRDMRLAGVSPLDGTLALFRPRSARASRATTPRRLSDEVLHVSGFVRTDGGEAVLAFLQRSDRVPDPPASRDAPYRVELRNDAGGLLGAAAFDLDEADAEAGWAWFDVALPMPGEADRVVVMRGQEEIAARDASAAAPEVRFTAPTAGARLSDREEIRWEGSDADGDGLLYSLLYSPTGEKPWRLFSLPSSRTAATLDIDDLEPGPQPTFRVIATDGFHESSAKLPVEIDGQLRVLATLPSVGTSDADPIAGIQVFFGSEVVEEQAVEAVRINGPEGETVPADARLLPGGRTLALSTLAPLDPGTRYEVSVESGLTDRYGNRLDSGVSWSFTTAGTEEEGAGDKMAADVGDDVPPAADQPDERPTEAHVDERPDDDDADRLGHGGTRWVSVRMAGEDALSFHGSGIDGSAAAEMICLVDQQGVFRIYDAAGRGSAKRGLNINTAGAVPADPTNQRLTVSIQYFQLDGELFQANEIPMEILRNEATADPDRRRFAARIRGAVLRSPSSDRRIELDVDFETNAACRRFRVGG